MTVLQLHNCTIQARKKSRSRSPEGPRGGRRPYRSRSRSNDRNDRSGGVGGGGGGASSAYTSMGSRQEVTHEQLEKARKLKERYGDASAR